MSSACAPIGSAAVRVRIAAASATQKAGEAERRAILEGLQGLIERRAVGKRGDGGVEMRRSLKAASTGFAGGRR